MKKTETVPAGQVLGLPVLAGLAGTLLLMAVGAFVILKGKADAAQVPALTLICLAAGGLCTAALLAFTSFTLYAGSTGNKLH